MNTMRTRVAILILAIAAGFVLLNTAGNVSNAEPAGGVVPQSSKSKVTYSLPIDDDQIPPGPDRAEGAFYKQFPAFLADVDGDGVRDFCRAVGGAPPNMACKLGKASGGFKYKQFLGPADIKGWYGSDKKPQWMEDVNEDGRADYCRYFGTGFVAALAEDYEFSDTDFPIQKTYKGWRLVK
jgi:hypothetical protein